MSGLAHSRHTRVGRDYGTLLGTSRGLLRQIQQLLSLVRCILPPRGAEVGALSSSDGLMVVIISVLSLALSLSHSSLQRPMICKKDIAERKRSG